MLANIINFISGLYVHDMIRYMYQKAYQIQKLQTIKCYLH
jgi:hypothetical protein